MSYWRVWRPFQWPKTPYESIHFCRFSMILRGIWGNMPYTSTLQRMSLLEHSSFLEKKWRKDRVEIMNEKRQIYLCIILLIEITSKTASYNAMSREMICLSKYIDELMLSCSYVEISDSNVWQRPKKFQENMGSWILVLSGPYF